MCESACANLNDALGERLVARLDLLGRHDTDLAEDDAAREVHHVGERVRDAVEAREHGGGDDRLQDREVLQPCDEAEAKGDAERSDAAEERKEALLPRKRARWAAPVNARVVSSWRRSRGVGLGSV